MTTYDKIKNMTLEELAQFIGRIHGSDIWCTQCTERYEDCYNEETNQSHCVEFALEFLKSEEGLGK